MIPCVCYPLQRDDVLGFGSSILKVMDLFEIPSRILPTKILKAQEPILPATSCGRMLASCSLIKSHVRPTLEVWFRGLLAAGSKKLQPK